MTEELLNEDPWHKIQFVDGPERGLFYRVHPDFPQDEIVWETQIITAKRKYLYDGTVQFAYWVATYKRITKSKDVDRYSMLADGRIEYK